MESLTPATESFLAIKTCLLLNERELLAGSLHEGLGSSLSELEGDSELLEADCDDFDANTTCLERKALLVSHTLSRQIWLPSHSPTDMDAGRQDFLCLSRLPLLE